MLPGTTGKRRKRHVRQISIVVRFSPDCSRKKRRRCPDWVEQVTEHYKGLLLAFSQPDFFILDTG